MKMPTVADVAVALLLVLIISLVIALVVFKVYEGYNPNNRL
jgi:hypothetical protein